jgi:hypothetical protein
MSRQAQQFSIGLLHIELRHAFGAKTFRSFGVLAVEKLLIFLEIFSTEAARKNEGYDYHRHLCEGAPMAKQKILTFLPYDL